MIVDKTDSEQKTDLDIDWPARVFAAKTMGHIEKLARRRFHEGVLADEAVTFVIDQLSNDDWARCRRFKGKSRPETFVYTLASHLVEEFARKRFGRPRPPSWLQAQGDLWVRMWKHLCLERLPMEAAFDLLAANGLRERESLRDIARTIKARMPNCGLSARDHLTVDDITSLSDGLSEQEDAPLESAQFASQRAAAAEAVLVLRGLLSTDEDGEKMFSDAAREQADTLSAEMLEVVQTFRQALQLTTEERLLLRMVFVDGMSKVKAARALGLSDHQGGRKLQGALARIQQCLTDNGLDIGTLLKQL